LARVAPPKVENEEFTVIDTVYLKADAGTVAGVPRVSRIAITGNGWSTYTSTSSTPSTTYNVA
jgi:hypothetical protein